VSRGLALAAAMVAVASISGCGGSTGTSKQDFVTKANKICAEGNQAVEGVAKQISAAQRASKASEVYRRVAALTKKAAATSDPYIDRLDALDTPSGDRDQLKAWVASVRQQETKLNELGTAFAKRQPAKIARLSEQIDTLDQKNNLFAKGYGMSDCATSVTNQ
jgi:hypothetical protein